MLATGFSCWEGLYGLLQESPPNVACRASIDGRNRAAATLASCGLSYATALLQTKPGLPKGDTPLENPQPNPQPMDELDLDRRRDLDHLEALLSPVLPAASPSAETSLTIRLSVALKQSLKTDAAERGLNLSDYVRLKLSDVVLPPRRRSSHQISSLERSVLVELNHLGTNLNQISRKLNSQTYSRINAGDRQMLTQLLTLLQRIKHTLISDPDGQEVDP